ncbi:MAG: TonB-dependent receptor [Candidatus Magnetomorum sp.]|nr:TonB-dependent receptor [Candidatus Magnetomorum sp.]
MFFQIVIRFMGCFIFILFSNYGFTQDTDTPVSLDAIVVTAEKQDKAFKTGDVDQEQFSAFHTRIDREEFEGKIEDLADVIEKEAGIQVRQSGGLGSFSSISLRGSTSDQVMVYLDGILLNDASGGGVDLSNISLADVESIEIYKGASPIHFGKASIGGVVNIRTLRNKKKKIASFSAGYGSFGTQKFAAFFNHNWQKLDYLISLDYLDCENDFDMLYDGNTKWNKEDDRWTKRNNAEFDQANIMSKVGFDISDHTRLDLTNQWFQKNQHLPSWNNSSNTKTTFDTQRNITTLQIIADDISPYHFNIRTRLDYSFKNEEYDDSEGHIGLKEQHSEYQTCRAGASFYAEWLSDIQTVSLTLDYWNETYQPEDLISRKNINDSNRNAFALGVQDNLYFFDTRLIVIPALRFTMIRNRLESAISTANIPLDRQTETNDYFQPQMGVKYCPIKGVIIKSNISKYIRDPSLFELFGDRGFFMGNEELQSEEGLNVDVGFSFEKEVNHPLFSRFFFECVGFFSDVDNLISRVYDARGIGKADNISKSRIQGFETNMILNFLDYFSWSVNASWQDSENISEIKHFNGKRLPGRFEYSFFSKLEARHEGFKLYLEYLAEKKMFYDAANLLEANDKDELNAGISCLFKNKWLLTLEGKNLGDDLYEDFNGYPRPGRSFFVSAKYTY